jgi:hypothetical protein
MVVEAAADDGSGLGHFLYRVQPIESRHQRVVQCSRDRKCAQRTVEVISILALSQCARFDDGLCHLLHKQRYAIGSRGDLVEQRLRQALTAGDAIDDTLGRRAAEPVQRQLCHTGMTCKGGDEGRAGGDQHENAYALHGFQRQFDQLQGRGIDPVRVLNHPQQGLAAGQPSELVDEDSQHAAPALLGRQRERAVARCSVETQQRRHKRCGFVDLLRGPRK